MCVGATLHLLPRCKQSKSQIIIPSRRTQNGRNPGLINFTGIKAFQGLSTVGGVNHTHTLFNTSVLILPGRARTLSMIQQKYHTSQLTKFTTICSTMKRCKSNFLQNQSETAAERQHSRRPHVTGRVGARLYGFESPGTSQREVPNPETWLQVTHFVPSWDPLVPLESV